MCSKPNDCIHFGVLAAIAAKKGVPRPRATSLGSHSIVFRDPERSRQRITTSRLVIVRSGDAAPCARKRPKRVGYGTRARSNDSTYSGIPVAANRSRKRAPSSRTSRSCSPMTVHAVERSNVSTFSERGRQRVHGGEYAPRLALLARTSRPRAGPRAGAPGIVPTPSVTAGPSSFMVKESLGSDSSSDKDDCHMWCDDWSHRRCSTIRQRSCTTSMPAAARRAANASSRMPDCSQTAEGRLATMSSKCGSEVGGFAEDVDEIDRTGDVDEPPEHGLAEDGRDLRVVHGHRDDLEPRPVEVSRHLDCGLAALRLGLDPEHGDALRPRQQGGNVGVRKEVRVRSAHGEASVRPLREPRPPRLRD